MLPPDDKLHSGPPHTRIVYLRILGDGSHLCKGSIFDRAEIEVLADPELVLAEEPVVDSVDAKPDTEGEETVRWKYALLAGE